MWQFIESNKRKTAILLVLMTSFLVFFGSSIGYLFTPAPDIYSGGGLDGVIIGAAISLICAIGIIFYAKFNASKFFLDQVNAVEIKKGDAPVLENIVEEMSISSALGFTPKIFVVNSPYPNAFSVGINKDNSAVAVTTALLSILNRDELTGVIAHEIAHIKNQDTLYLMYAGVIFGIIIAISDVLIRSNLMAGRRRSSSRETNGEALIILFIILFAILSPIMARLLYFSLSREREYLADASAVQYTRYPTGLAGALNKISNFTLTEGGAKKENDGANELIRCMYIHNRLQGKENFFSTLFATHPPVEKRIAILKKMGAADFGEYNKVYSAVQGGRALFSQNEIKKMNIAPVAIMASALETKEEARIERQRKIKDTYYKSKNYKIIKCECGTVLKIPPEIEIKNLTCPHCKKINEIE